MVELLEVAAPKKAWTIGEDGELKTLPDTISRLKSLTGDAVLIQILPPPERTRGGLWIPETANQNKSGYEGALAGRLRRGIVIATGPGKVDSRGVLHPMEVQAGDSITFYYLAQYEWLHWPAGGESVIFPERFIQSVIIENEDW